MNNKNKRTAVCKALEPLRRRFEGWRKSRKSGSERIPEELWSAAARAAKSHGVAAVAKILKLDYYGLRDRTGGKKAAPKAKVLDSEPAFIELSPSCTARGLPNAIEIQRTRGSRVRIEFEGAASRELLQLSEKLWRAAR